MQSYPVLINSTLIPSDKPKWVAVDLFAGCGGLALGFEAAGFATLGFEKDQDACETYRRNLAGSCVKTVLTPVSELPECDVLIGGPPCQPFSVGGHQNGLDDSRDGFPTFIAAVKKLRPRLRKCTETTAEPARQRRNPYQPGATPQEFGDKKEQEG